MEAIQVSEQLRQQILSESSSAHLSELTNSCQGNARAIYPRPNLDVITTTYKLPIGDDKMQYYQAVLISHEDVESFMAIRSASAKTVTDALSKMLQGMQKELAEKQIVPGVVVKKEGSAIAVDR
jgi:hypothetical protein